MKKTLAILAGSTLAVSIAVAQGKPTDKPAAAPAMAPAAAPKAAPTAAAPKAAAPAAQPSAKAAPAAAAPGAPAAAAAKPAAAPAAAPAPAAPPAPPKPGPELEAAFKFFEGSWKCETKFPAGAMGPGSPEMSAKSSVKFKKALGGFFYEGDYEVKKSKTNPGMKATFFLGYVAGAKVYTSTGFDDMGGMGNLTSAGLQGETMSFQGDGYIMGQKVKVRESFTRKAPKGANHKFEVDMGKGFQVLGDDECAR